MRNRVFILGAGGHAKVVAEIIQLQGHTLSGFLDDSPSLIGQHLMGLPIVGPISELNTLNFDGVVIGIGDNESRHKISHLLSDLDDNLWLEARHPSAIISSNAEIGLGTMSIAGSIINIHAQIGSHCIINTGATVDHDCMIDSYAHIGPGAHLAGTVIVGKGAFVATGANIIPSCTIGKWAMIGAGAVVTKGVPDYGLVVGNPARLIGYVTPTGERLDHPPEE